ncbi:hypothetical protein KCU90_g955, partial [Aureobasidium melanogenum]
MAGTHPPYMQVDHLVSAILDRVTYALRHAPVGVHVEQDRSRVAHQAVRPVCNHQRADDTGERVHPEPAKCAGQHEAYDRQHGNRRIRHHVDVRRPDVVVTGRCFMRVVVVFMFFEFHFVLAVRNPHDGLEGVDKKPDHRDGNRFTEMDGYRRQETGYRLVANQKRNHREHDGTRKAREIAKLAPVNDFDELFRRASAILLAAFRVDEVIPDVVFQHDREKTVHSPATTCDPLQHVRAAVLFLERPLDGFDLSLDAADPIK